MSKFNEKQVKCDVCGSLIEVETGDTFYAAGSNADKIVKLQDENTRLKHDLVRIKNENDELKGLNADAIPEKNDDGTDDGTDDDGYTVI